VGGPEDVATTAMEQADVMQLVPFPGEELPRGPDRAMGCAGGAVVAVMIVSMRVIY